MAIGFMFALFWIQKIQNQSISNENIAVESQNDATFNRADYLPTSNHQVVHHRTYSLSYNKKHEQAEWTAHILTTKDIQPADYKRPYFEIDDMVSTGAASWRNYKNSGYDRGHLVPAGDRRGSLADYEETFLTSNISPQLHEFNAGNWNDLEQKIRRYAKMESLYVVTGSILTDDLSSIGNEEVSVPEYFYKIVYKDNNGKPTILSFLVPHAKTDRSINDFKVSVDHIEELTGIDFFSQLPDDIEIRIESTYDATGW
ncbi:DNA/RNA non-specific endonuclease [Nonlabens marinus S1-08]|uniref:Endonuclease n=1 Tax=Nonlabens marinus S1-08 TaxID=1454201 RepID=W8VX74_9FLAO|nr:DNA/RNA non-specific endonuclease [Nonlabens marinus S1-08]